MSLLNFFEKLNKTSLYIGLFLIPIFFFPFTQNVLDFPKQFLTLILICISFIGWLGKVLYQKKIILFQNKTFYLILLLIFFSYTISFLLSPNIRIFFSGPSFEVLDSFLTLILFLAFLFLLLNSFKEKFEFFYLIFFLILSSTIIGIFNLFQLYGLYILPFDFTKNPSFNPIGSPNALSLFFVIILPLSLALFLKNKEKSIKMFFGLISFVLFINILLINYKLSWLLLIIETIFFFHFYVK